jgi:3-oxoacyl-[acyl-carrier protein] reductase
MSYPDLKENTYVVTGAASGIGRATSMLLAQQGANVALVDLHKPEHVLEEVEKLGGKALAFSCDVQDGDALEVIMNNVVQRFGGIDGAANMAGILGSQGIKGKGYAVDRVHDDEWDQILGVNLSGVKNSMRAELRHMKDGGAVVNAGSIAGQLGLPFMAPYCASKWAVLGLTKVAAQEFGSRGIRINAVAP